MAKSFVFQFGSGNPTLMTGLTPTFVIFKNVGGSALTAPGMTELPTSTGLYYTTYGPTQAIAFLLDGGSGAGSNRFVSGAFDPVQAVDESITSLGATLFNTLGTTASSFGGTLVEPASVYGYLKRLQEFNEGNQIFTKSSGTWDIFARGNLVGATVQLIEKVIVDNGTTVTKS